MSGGGPDDEPAASHAHAFSPLEDAPDLEPLEREALPLGGDRAFLLRHALSKSECRHYIGVMEGLGFSDLDTGGGGAGRVVADSPGLAALMWARYGERFISDVVVGIGEPDPSLQEPFGANGVWKACGIGRTFAACKYTGEAACAHHCDGMFVRQRGDKERSWKTIMVYLNDDFEGGATNFLKDVAPLQSNEERRPRATPDQIRHKVMPEAGTAIIFNHRLLHEGETVTAGVKYMLRSDVMYTRVVGEDMDPNDRDALLLFRNAQAAEAEGEMGTAASLYRRAFKMSPRLAEAYGDDSS